MSFKKWKPGYALFVLALLLVSLGGCGGSGDGKPEPSPSKPLTHWNGEWKSSDSFLEDAAMDPVYDAVSAKASGYTSDGVKGFFEDMCHTDFESLLVKDNKIFFKDESGKVLGSVVYEAKGNRPTGFEGVEWHLFEAVPSSAATQRALHGDENFNPAESCKYLVMMKVHADEPGGMEHWHMRYGPKGFDALTNDKTSTWWPTLLPPKITPAVYSQELLGEAAEMAKFLPAPLAGWEGRWVSAHSLMNDAKMTAAYEAIAAKAKSLGKDYTAGDVKAYYQAMFKTDFDFVEVKGNEAVYSKQGGSVLAVCKYVNDGHPSDRWTAWKGESGSSAEYKDVAAVVVHGEGDGRHWHLRYGVGKTIKELVAMKGWTPTCYDPKVTTADVLAKKYLEGAAKRAESLPKK